jgi:hypothetical protein
MAVYSVGFYVNPLILLIGHPRLPFRWNLRFLAPGEASYALTKLIAFKEQMLDNFEVKPYDTII